MQNPFTTEQLDRLKQLFLELGFSNQVLISNKPGSFSNNVVDIMFNKQPRTLEEMHFDLKRQIRALEDDEFNNNNDSKIEYLTKWKEFIRLVILRNKHQLELSTIKQEELKKERKELATLEQIETQLELKELEQLTLEQVRERKAKLLNK